MLSCLLFYCYENIFNFTWDCFFTIPAWWACGRWGLLEFDITLPTMFFSVCITNAREISATKQPWDPHPPALLKAWIFRCWQWYWAASQRLLHLSLLAPSFVHMSQRGFLLTKPLKEKQYFSSLTPVTHCHLSLLFLSILNKHCQKQNEDEENVLHEKHSLFMYKRATFPKGNYLRFFLMLDTTWTGKLPVLGLEMKNGEPLSLAALRQGHFWFQPSEKI